MLGGFSLASFMYPFSYLCFQRFANEFFDDFVCDIVWVRAGFVGGESIA